MKNVLFGSVCVWLALAFSIVAVVLYIQVQRGRENLRGWAWLSFVLVAQGVCWAAFYLMFLILTHRYEVGYVAEYSSSDLPLASLMGLKVPFYLFSCFWAGQQGTFFLWAIDACVLGILFMSRCKRSYEAPAMAVMGLITFFLTLLLSFASPFTVSAITNVPSDGQGLNILLQNPWMVIHPPIMFLGFSSLSVPFALGISALVRREYDEWINVAWPWVLFAWCALGTGLFMGGYWAYTVLGWGGFWGWDNVENSSLIPWLATTALIHGMLLQRARGSMKRANLLFVLTPYVFVLTGSFLTRSGVLADFSVHSFAAPAQAIFDILIIYLAVFFVIAVVALAMRIRSVPTSPAFEEGEETSRGFFFVIGAWLLYAISIWTMIGTCTPLITKLPFFKHPFNAQQYWYNRNLFPLVILLCIMMSVTPFLKWRGKPAEATTRVLAASVMGAVLLTLGLTLFNGVFYEESLRVPADAIIRSNPAAYEIPASPRPSGVLLNGRTSAQGAVTTVKSGRVQIGSYSIPAHPSNMLDAYVGAVKMRYGWAYPFFCLAAFFCIIANGYMVYRITGFSRRSWLPAGGFLSHMGVGLLLIGAITSLNYGGDATVSLNAGKPHQTTDTSVDYPDAQPLEVFGHSFTFQGYDINAATRTATMRVAVRTGDETVILHPRLTQGKDGSWVHFPGIRKYPLEDLYLSPVKLPGQDGQQAQEFKFHVRLSVTHNGQTTSLAPGLSLSMDGSMHPTDTPTLPGSGYQLVLNSLQTPGRDDPNQPAVMDLSLRRIGSFQTNDGSAPSVKLAVGKTVEIQGYTFKFAKWEVDQSTKDSLQQAQKEASSAQIEISTKPLIDIVWLGTFFIIGGGALAARKRTLEARRQADRRTDD